MVELNVHDKSGNVVETLDFDESCLGRFVNMPLLHSYIVMYEANQRQGTVCTKNRRRVVGSRTKPYRQKGTGRARMGFRRRVGSRGGAVGHGPQPRDHSRSMPKKAKRAALKSALLGKLRDGEIVVIDGLNAETPKTKEMAQTLKNLKIDKGCTVVLHGQDANVWKSLRNLPATELATLQNLNAYLLLRRKHVLITKDALAALPQEIQS